VPPPFFQSPLQEEQLEAIVDQLVEAGYAFQLEFLSSQEVNHLIERMGTLSQGNAFFQAGIGKQTAFQVNREIRRDWIYWIEPEEEPEALQSVFSKITQVREYLNRTCYLGLKTVECHYAMYPPGSFYKRHVDQFQHNAHRLISFVFYLNPAWEEKDGGKLRLFPKEGILVDIPPVGGSAIFFKSEIPHEVRLAHAHRWSLTGWMLDREPSLTFW